MVDTQTFGNGRVRFELTDRSGRFYSTQTSPKQGREAFFDANNRISGIDNSNTGDDQTFSHDGLNRLTGLTSNASGNQSFGYDPSSNRSVQVRGIQEDYQIDPASNRISQITRTVESQPQTLRTYAYRATGEVASITGGASDLISESRFEYPLRNLTFSYDPFNRLKQVTGQNLNATYKISATNLRVAKAVNGKTTHFIYGLSGQLLYEVDLTTNRTSAHVYFNGKPIALIRNGVRSYVLTDHLGRPELLMDDTPAANTVWKATLSAFDKVAVTVDTIGGYHLGFPGQYFDEETGFAHNIHRDYDSSSGRYLQPDPIGLAGGINPYAYVGGNPVMRIDPLGLWALNISLFRGFGGSAVIGGSGLSITFVSARGGIGFGGGISFDPFESGPDEKIPCDAKGPVNGVGFYGEVTGAKGVGAGISVNGGMTQYKDPLGRMQNQAYGGFEGEVEIGFGAISGYTLHGSIGFELTHYFVGK